ncbi:hypothetical protein, partial [Brevibacillus laterosporus]|uniref:hypothetical protein n=1 Tax=Brevibacillus laterosporus TaxID=1465 RepID=UPI003D214A1E
MKNKEKKYLKPYNRSIVTVNQKNPSRLLEIKKSVFEETLSKLLRLQHKKRTLEVRQTVDKLF